MGERVSRRGRLAAEQRVDALLGVLAGPPDQLQRDAFAIPGHEPRRRVLRAPAAELGEPACAREVEAGREVELLRRDDQHLDVGHLVRDPARDAAGEDDLLGDVRRKGVGEALRQILELGAALRGHAPLSRHPRIRSIAACATPGMACSGNAKVELALISQST